LESKPLPEAKPRELRAATAFLWAAFAAGVASSAIEAIASQSTGFFELAVTAAFVLFAAAATYSSSGVSSGGGYAPNYLPGLGSFFSPPQFTVVVCRDCGLTRFFASPEAVQDRRGSLGAATS
jgi:hypothetical protein